MTEKTLILSSGKCAWAKCFACGWGKLKAPVDVEKSKQKVKSLDLTNVDKLKIFASGSFLDKKQFPIEFRKWLVDYLKEKGVKELVVESRPESVTPKTLADFKGLKLTVAIGLECADDKVLKKYKKGFTVDDYLKAVKMLREDGCGVRTYIMVNIPFGADKLEKSAEFALKHSDSIVLINTFPHSKSELFDYWIKGEWKPYDKKQFDEAVKKWKSNPKTELDFQNYLFVPKFPPEKRIVLHGATSKILNHPYFEVWQDYFQRFYESPEKEIVLFLPCSYKKPYSRSRTHKQISKALQEAGKQGMVHKIVASTPGVVPIEFADFYPFNSYDWEEWEETPEIKKEYVDVTAKRVRAYLENHKYKRYLCYLKYTETYEALRKACGALKIELVNLLDKEVYDRVKDKKNPIIQPLALSCLKKNLKSIS